MVLHGQWTWHNLHHVHKSYWNKYTTHCILQGLVFLDTLSFWQFSACKGRFYINIDLGSQRLDIFAYAITWTLICKGQYYANRYRSAEGTVCIFSFFGITGSWLNSSIPGQLVPSQIHQYLNSHIPGIVVVHMRPQTIQFLAIYRFYWLNINCTDVDSCKRCLSLICWLHYVVK